MSNKTLKNQTFFAILEGEKIPDGASGILGLKQGAEDYIIHRLI